MRGLSETPRRWRDSFDRAIQSKSLPSHSYPYAPTPTLPRRALHRRLPRRLLLHRHPRPRRRRHPLRLQHRPTLQQLPLDTLLQALQLLHQRPDKQGSLSCRQLQRPCLRPNLRGRHAGSTFYTYTERMAERAIIMGYPCGGPREPAYHTLITVTTSAPATTSPEASYPR